MTVALAVTSSVAVTTSDPAIAVDAGSSFRPVAPARLLDTRIDPTSHRVGERVQRVRIAGSNGVPADATAVALGVHATGGAAAGFVTVWPTGTAMPLAATLNHIAAEPGAANTTSNVTMMQLGADGSVDVYASVAVDLVIDLTGWFASAAADGSGRFHVQGPTRPADTRSSGGPVPASGALRVTLPGDVPSTAIAAVVRITTDLQANTGFVTADAVGRPRPETAVFTVDHQDQTVGAATVVALQDRSFLVHSSAGGHVIVDLMGWFSGPTASAVGGLFVPQAPTRRTDTRDLGAAVRSGASIGVAAGGPVAVGNLALISDRSGFATMFAAGGARPDTATVNAPGGGIAASSFGIAAAPGGAISVLVSAGGHVVFDQTGVFTDAISTTPVPPVPQPGPSRLDRVRWQGQDWFLGGVNLPWITWPWAAGHGDFGGGTGDGVRSHLALLASRFAALQQAGVHVVRWWMFEDSAWQIQRDANGRPTGIDPAVYPDIDAAITLAKTYDLSFDFVLFGGPSGFPASWRTNADHRQALADVLGSLFARYADEPRVMTWEIFNEPEWEVWNSGGVVSEADVKAMATTIIRSIRSNAPNALVTIGSALVGGFNASQHAIDMWTDVDLDYYSPHWYDHQTSPPWPLAICALCQTADSLRAKYGTAKPIVIGEFQEGFGTTSANLARLEQWRALGYAGAWGWSLFPEYTGDHHPTDLTAWAQFTAAHADVGPRTG